MIRSRATTLLATIVLAALLLPAGVSAHPAHVWSNSDGFSSRCVGFTNTYPAQLYNLARAQLGRLAFTPIYGALGSSFTRDAVLNSVASDWAFYVHSHGDNYWAASGAPRVDSGFLQDPGTSRCNDYRLDNVRSSALKARTSGIYNFVVMSTCMLGSSSSTMPPAFGIPMTKTGTQAQFYLGYAYLTYDSAQLRFENAFWSKLTAVPFAITVGQAFSYAKSIGGYAAPDASNPFAPNWWGNANYYAVPGTATGCLRCV